MKKILYSLLFLIIGITIFWFVYRGFEIKKLKAALEDIRYEWVIISICLGLLSHFFRALRWRMLINTMNYKPGITNLFLSVIVLYFTNLIIPRGGEVSRCMVISKYEGVPVMKLFGTVFTERITDLFTFFLLFLIVLFSQFNFFKTIFSYPGFQIDFSSFQIKLFPLLLIFIVLAALIIMMSRFRIFKRIYAKLVKVKKDFLEGISVIVHMKGKAIYITYTLIIFLLWLIMYYTLFFAYPPTNNISVMVAVLTYTFSTLAYLLPIQAGIGAWHFIVINCLFYFGINKDIGMIFAIIAHTFTSLVFLIFGPLALIFLFLINRKKTDI
jgi:glycosyltransferase 2 family protein